uniref:Uncharacterized protein n=1 Tax=Arundo donax TaxID=35708 RepID=A0A0A9EQA4_ARUDO
MYILGMQNPPFGSTPNNLINQKKQHKHIPKNTENHESRLQLINMNHKRTKITGAWVGKKSAHSSCWSLYSSASPPPNTPRMQA